MTKAFDKIMAGAKQALRAARGDATVIKDCRVTPSYGCVFCDFGLVPGEKGHFVPAHSGYPDQWMPCTSGEQHPNQDDNQD